ncbi:MAG: hypothetical protein HQK89_17450 [Nitrospirae bacterium]|nr:hypothetical protein [Nitrospirota bacterium]
MSKLSEKLEKLFSAVTFAEAGEFDTAREIQSDIDSKDKLNLTKVN